MLTRGLRRTRGSKTRTPTTSKGSARLGSPGDRKMDRNAARPAGGLGITGTGGHQQGFMGDECLKRAWTEFSAVNFFQGGHSKSKIEQGPQHRQIQSYKR